MTRSIKYMPIDTLVPALRNPRRHQLDMLRKSFDRFGFTVPIILDERTGRLVAGHGRTQLLQIVMAEGNAAPPEGVMVRESDLMWQVPVVRGWSSQDDAEAEAYLIADNRLTEIAGWDNQALVDSLARLQASRGLEGIGYLPEDVDDLYAKLQESAPSVTPEPNSRNAQVRSLVLDYPLDQYGYVAATAHRARAHYDVPSNAELFVAMLKEYAEETPA
jgi:hypothetical protein